MVIVGGIDQHIQSGPFRRMRHLVQAVALARHFRTALPRAGALTCVLFLICNGPAPAYAKPPSGRIGSNVYREHPNPPHRPYRRTLKRRGYVAHVCRRMELEAKKWQLPPGFLIRLIWTESRFDPDAISPKGAGGIAQFMPATAKKRGLIDRFDPKSALRASAHYLAEFKHKVWQSWPRCCCVQCRRGRCTALAVGKVRPS